MNEVSLDIGEGQRVALLGSSGAGKTTLLDVLSGLVAPTSGTVRVLGQNPSGLRGRRRRSHASRIGLVTQDLDLALPLRVVHNVNGGRLGRWSTAKALWSLLRPLGHAQVSCALTAVGLEGRVGSRTGDLSGGERQRVAVARVLIQGPEVVLADEPTSSVDPTNTDIVLGLLCDPDRPWTTVFSAHDPDLARCHATRVIGLRAGAVVFDLPADRVADRDLSGLYHPST